MGCLSSAITSASVVGFLILSPFFASLFDALHFLFYEKNCRTTISWSKSRLKIVSHFVFGLTQNRFCQCTVWARLCTVQLVYSSRLESYQSLFQQSFNNGPLMFFLGNSSTFPNRFSECTVRVSLYSSSGPQFRLGGIADLFQLCFNHCLQQYYSTFLG